MRARLARLWGWAVEHPVLFVFLVALTSRVVLAVGVFVAHHGTLFADDLYFQRLARDMADGATSRWTPYDREIFYATSTFLWPLTLLARLASPVLPGQLMVAVAGAGAAALTTVVGLRALRVRWAIAAGLVMALLPSMVLWSSLTLKDAFVWCALAGLGVAVCELEGPPWRFVLVGASAVALLVALEHLRQQTFVVAVWGVMAAFVLGAGRQWRQRIVFGAAVLLVLPAVLGYGVAAGSWIDDAAHGLVDRREGNTVDAASVLTCALPGHAHGPFERARCGVPGVLLRPYPWERGGSSALGLARLENLLWYPILAAAVYGLTRVWPVRRALGFAVLVSINAIAVYASVEGNLGTAFRHRAEAAWGVALLAALGGQTLASRRDRADRFPLEPERASTLAAEHGA